MIEIRPDLQPAYDSLCYQGKQFPEQHTITELDGLSFTHPKKGETPIAIDADVLAMQGMTYVGSANLRQALGEHGIPAAPTTAAATLLSEHFQSKDTRIWGFSGYATGGIDQGTGRPFGYQAEADGLRELYGCLEERGQLPSLAIDGGVSEGFLAVNSVVARSVQVPTLGFIPRQGLASIGVRDHMIVAGDTYQDRETLVGTADVLVCAGGDKGTVRECLEATLRGAAVLVLVLKDYPAASLAYNFRSYDELWDAYNAGRLVECRSLEQIGDSVDRILEAGITGRQQRNDVVRNFLSADARD